MNPAHQRYVDFLQRLTRDCLDELEQYVAADVRFADPFNDLVGNDGMKRVFEHMFDTLGDVRFDVHDAVSEGPVCLLNWTFHARLRGQPWRFSGTSVVRFDDDGRVVEHRDHWDAARHFYERIPVIGWLLRLIRNRLGVG